MYILFINDDHVPATEYEAIIRLLDDNAIEYVERPRLIGSLFRFGSTGAGCNLVVESEAQYRRARQLIDEYQKNLVETSRASYRARKASNRNREIIGWLFGLSVIAAILMLSLSIGF